MKLENKKWLGKKSSLLEQIQNCEHHLEELKADILPDPANNILHVRIHGASRPAAIARLQSFLHSSMRPKCATPARTCVSSMSSGQPAMKTPQRCHLDFTQVRSSEMNSTNIRDLHPVQLGTSFLMGRGDGCGKTEAYSRRAIANPAMALLKMACTGFSRLFDAST